MITFSSINFETEIPTFGGLTNFTVERLLQIANSRGQRTTDGSVPTNYRQTSGIIYFIDRSER